MQTIKTVDRFYYRELGEQLRKWRIHRDMTLKELSNATGISRSQLDHYELGLNKINDKNLNKICTALNVSTSIDVKVTIGLGFLNV